MGRPVVPAKQLGRQLTGYYFTYGLDHDRESIDSHQKEEVDVLNDVKLHEFLVGIEPNVGVACDVRIPLEIIGVDVVLDHMLMYPGYGAATDPVLAHAQDPVDPWVSADGSMIGIMLDVQA